MIIVLAAASPAGAFPTLTTRGAVPRCTMCHISPGGGGMLNEYGRNEAGDTLSRGGDGRFLNGAWEPPSWLLLGGDFRAAALDLHETMPTEGNELAAFPMQADLRAGVTAGGFTVVATGGLRGSTRLYSKSAADYVQSSEHYAMYSHESGFYVRAGKFFPVQGLRLPDHTLYTERYTGMGLFEEPYGGDIGFVGDRYEVHAAGFVHDSLVNVGRDEAGGVLYMEIHDPDWAAAVSARYGSGPEAKRTIVGLSGRVAASRKLIFLGEVDGIHDQIVGATAINQAIALVGADQQIVRGLNVFGWYEQFQEELLLKNGIHHDAGIAIDFYPHAHWELITEGRVQRLGPNNNAELAMLQLHYYL